MWPTTDGSRMLTGDEASLVRGVAGMMLDDLVAEGREGDQQHPVGIDWPIGIDWYDQWDWRQRTWLLDQVTAALLTPQPAPPPAAMFEATIDAIYFQTLELIRSEIEDPGITSCERTWRESTIAAYGAQQGRPPRVDAECKDLDRWRLVTTTIADAILGPRNYTRAESFRDSDPATTETFLLERGLPPDYLSQIPPLRSIDQTQWSIDRIQNLVFRSGG